MRFPMFNLLLFCLPLLSISYLTLCHAESDAEPQTRTSKLLNPSDIIRIKSLAFDTVLKLSPDRKYLAYTVANPERKSISLPRTTKASNFLPTGALKNHHNCEIWVTHISTRESHILTSDVGGNWAPQWSPNGRYVAFYSDRTGTSQLWVWDRIENKQRRISEKPISAIYGFEVPIWTSDGKHLITKLRPEGEDYFKVSTSDSDEQAISVWETGTDAQADTARKAQRPGHVHGDLAILDFETGASSILTKGLYALNMLLSPNDDVVAVLNLIGQEKLTSQAELFELLLVPLDGTPIQRLATNITNGLRNISWSPDGKYLAYMHPDGMFLVATDRNEQRNLTADLAEKPNFFTHALWNESSTTIFSGFDGHVWELQTDGSGGRKLTEGLNRNIREIVPGRNPYTAWESNDPHSIYLRTYDPKTKHAGFYQVEIAEAQAIRLFEAPINMTGFWWERNLGNSEQIVHIAEAATYPEEVWIYDITSGKRRQITNLNPHLSDIRFGETRLIDAQTTDRQHLQGALMLPVDHEEGKHYPLVVLIYPSVNLSDSVYNFGFGTNIINFQLLANRGYAVLAIDIPLHTNEPLKEIPEFVLPAVDKVIEMGITDSDRLGIMGYSYGGYGTVGVIAQTTRFKAAVVGGGVYNIISYYNWLGKDGRSGGIGWAEGGQGRMSGSLWEQRQQYIDNSPIFHLDKVETPLLIYCGDGYDGGDFAQSRELFSALRRLNKTATLVRYHSEMHNPPTWRPEHRVDAWDRIMGWFENHLK